MKLAYLFWALSPSIFSLTAHATVSDAEVEKAKQDIAEYERLKKATEENSSSKAERSPSLPSSEEDKKEEDSATSRRNQELRPLTGDNPYYREHKSASSRLGNKAINRPRGTTGFSE